MSARFAVGIDLGTTHCAIARIALGDAKGTTEPLAIEQRVSGGAIEARDLLPSFVYLPPVGEGPQVLSWDKERLYAVGAHARDRAAEVPDRVIASAKSWLCHPTVDRRSGLLPLGAPEDVEKISPVEASWRYLEHLCEAYDAAFAERDGPLCEQEVVLTVPASFDAAARDLTVEAAMAAGIEQLTLLEEPQAALYAWLEVHTNTWRDQLQPGDVVLVIDVGGGTTDFSAIEVREQQGAVELERVAVGDHILLGGDNIDLALAHHLKQRFEADGAVIDNVQLAALSHACRGAKERLLGSGGEDTVPVVVAARGAALVGATLRGELDRQTIAKLVLDGFFPLVDAQAQPQKRAQSGLRKLGLPYASDAGVTRHLADFVARHGDGGPLRVTALLFNGGVMRSDMLRERLCDVLSNWLEGAGQRKPRVLPGADLDRAVACGAAYYGRVRHGSGIRIRGGTARAYYVGIEGAAPAIPGVEPPITLLCVAPFGLEEGTQATLPPHELAVVVGEPVQFRFFSSSVRRHDPAGAAFDRWDAAEIGELPAIEMTLPAEQREEGEVVPVRLSASITAVGTLLIEALPLEPRTRDERWKVELSVRGRADSDR